MLFTVSKLTAWCLSAMFVLPTYRLRLSWCLLLSPLPRLMSYRTCRRMRLRVNRLIMFGVMTLMRMLGVSRMMILTQWMNSMSVLHLRARLRTLRFRDLRARRCRDLRARMPRELRALPRLLLLAPGVALANRCRWRVTHTRRGRAGAHCGAGIVA